MDTEGTMSAQVCAWCACALPPRRRRWCSAQCAAEARSYARGRTHAIDDPAAVVTMCGRIIGRTTKLAEAACDVRCARCAEALRKKYQRFPQFANWVRARKGLLPTPRKEARYAEDTGADQVMLSV